MMYIFDKKNNRSSLNDLTLILLDGLKSLTRKWIIKFMLVPVQQDHKWVCSGCTGICVAIVRIGIYTSDIVIGLGIVYCTRNEGGLPSPEESGISLNRQKEVRGTFR